MYWSPISKVLGVPPRKTIPGHEFAGVVDAIGKEVTNFKIGDAVFGTTTGLTVGAHAEYVCVPESWTEGVIARKPDNMTFAQAAALPVGSMAALYLLQGADIQAGEQVLIYGASGSVGTYAVQLARYFGADVTGVCSTRNVDLVQSLGAKVVIDYTIEDFSQRDDRYDVIFDVVGKVSAEQRKRALKSTGRYTSTRSLTHESADAFALVADLAEAGHIRPIIDRCVALENISEAYQHVASKRKAGNIVVQTMAGQTTSTELTYASMVD
jgi:NADPH:quinone reductase-like Zn-dependent oxidoreductase